jgi:hypothetical protein
MPYLKTIAIYGHTNTNVKQFSVQNQVAQDNYGSVGIMKYKLLKNTKYKILCRGD